MNENEINQEQKPLQQQADADVKNSTESANSQTSDTQENHTQDKNAQEKAVETKPNQFRKRLVSMLVLAISTGIAGNVLIALIIGQTLFSFFTKKPNESMKALSKELTDYVYKSLNYLSFNSEECPFPYQAWNDKKEASISNVEASA